jgi:hypothetical protein
MEKNVKENDICKLIKEVKREEMDKNRVEDREVEV